MMLLNQESLKKVVPVAGVLVGAPLLSRATTGKAKNEGAMQEMHCNGGEAATGTARRGRLRRRG
jgi:hypothetical protein